MKSCQMYRFIPIMLLCVCLFTGGYSQNKDQPSATHNQTPATEAASHTDHTPQVLTPQADGTKTFTTDTAVIDISHTQEGYIMAKYTGSNAKPKLQLTGTDGVTYTYSLYKDYSTFPLTSGDGTYQVGVYENVSDDRYTTLLSETFSVTLTDPLKPYLYPNQYVNFTADSLPVAKAEELADGASSDLDIISSVYNYIITHFTYDYSKASSVKSGYLPDIDEVFTSEKGICFDYAAVMTFLMIAVILVLIAKVVPVFSKVYAELGSELTGTASYLTALRAALRQSPDVILLGEMRDYETINTAVTAAETGHMIFSSLHTIGAANTIDRILPEASSFGKRGNDPCV